MYVRSPSPDDIVPLPHGKGIASLSDELTCISGGKQSGFITLGAKQHAQAALLNSATVKIEQLINTLISMMLQ